MGVHWYVGVRCCMHVGRSVCMGGYMCVVGGGVGVGCGLEDCEGCGAGCVSLEGRGAGCHHKVVQRRHSVVRGALGRG